MPGQPESCDSGHQCGIPGETRNSLALHYGRELLWEPVPSSHPSLFIPGETWVLQDGGFEFVLSFAPPPRVSPEEGTAQQWLSMGSNGSVSHIETHGDDLLLLGQVI